MPKETTPYENLLLEAGGGIIDAAQQAEQDNNAIVAIGLGGTGTDCLRAFKSKVYTRVKPDDPDAVVPRYSHIKFLSVDTDINATKNHADGSLGHIDMGSEFFDLSFSGNLGDYWESQKQNIARDPVYREWLRTDIEVGAVMDGAGGIRQVGRFLLMQKAGQFVERVKALISASMSGLNSPEVYVHIFSGMGGGTGSGTFLDACYLVRKAIHDSGLEHARVMGYFFLPDVNLRPQLNEKTKSYIMSNGYAAMQELDYCMGFGSNGSSWHQEYPGLGLVEYRQQPVDMCHLISGRNDKGDEIPNAYDYAMNVVTDYLMDFTAKPYSTPENQPYGLKSHFSNVKTTKEAVAQSAGACIDYVVLGASSAVVPYTRILTYLASNALSGLGNVLGQAPSEQEGFAFASSLGITYDQIYQRITQRVNLAFPIDKDLKPADAKRDTGLVVTRFEDMKARAQGQIKANYEVLARGTGGAWTKAAAQGDQNQGPVAVRVLAGIRDAIADPSRGPAWAAAMLLGGGGHDLPAQLEGIKVHAQEMLNQERYNLSEKSDNFNLLQRQSQEAFLASNFLGQGKALQKFQNATRNAVRSEALCTAYSAVIDLCDTVKQQLVAMSANFTEPLLTCAYRLDATFRSDASYLTHFVDGEKQYEVPIITMSEVRPTLDATLKGIDADAMVRGLMEVLLSDEAMDAWSPQGPDDGKLARIVSDYFLKMFHSFSARSIEQYLSERFGEAQGQLLAQRVEEGMLEGVDAKAAPLFWRQTGFSLQNANLTGYVTVPQSAPAIDEASKLLIGAHSEQALTRRPTAVTDRISVLRVTVGVPMWAYKGVTQYETKSLGNLGRHLYEGAARVKGVEPPANARDWRLLPSPDPYSSMTGNPSEHDSGILARANGAAELFEKGQEAKVVVRSQNEDGYDILVLSESFMQDVRKTFDAGSRTQNPERRKDYQQQLQGFNDHRVYDDEARQTLRSPAKLQGIDPDRYCLDLFVREPVRQEAVRAELAKVQELADDIDALAPKRDAALEGLCKALFTNVIPFTSPRNPITYGESEWGEETVLCDREMEHRGAPLYQAYLTYRELPVDVRKEIEDKADEAERDMADQDPEVIAACRAVKAELGEKAKRLKYIKESFPDEVSEFKETVGQMESELSKFLGNNFIELE